MPERYNVGNIALEYDFKYLANCESTFDEEIQKLLTSLNPLLAGLPGNPQFLLRPNKDVITAEPIPTGIYFNLEADNFYDDVSRDGQGTMFYARWRSRASEFPTAPPAEETDGDKYDKMNPDELSEYIYGRGLNWAAITDTDPTDSSPPTVVEVERAREYLRKHDKLPAPADDGEALTTIYAVQAALLKYRPDQLDLVHNLAADCEMDSDKLTLGQYKTLILEEASFAESGGSDALPADAGHVAQDKYANDLRVIAKRIDIGKMFPGHPDALIESTPVDAETLATQLLLVEDFEVAEEQLAALTPEERWEISNWAAAVMLSASDNDDVVVPEKPEFVKKLKNRPFP